jgi:hypothetical protein
VSCGTSLRDSESQLLLSEELKRAVTFGVDGISEAAVNGRKHRDDRARFVIIGNVFDLLANRKLRHRKLLFGFVDAIISAPAGRGFLTMYLPEFGTMVVALMSHPALGREPICTGNAKSTWRDIGIESEIRFEAEISRTI